MPKILLLTTSLAVVILTALATLFLNSGQKTISKNEVEIAVNQAKHLYDQEKERGRDFSSGPCLSNALMPGWVLDIAHNPRQKIDDLAENQCSAYIEGRAQHFVELDTVGNLIKAK